MVQEAVRVPAKNVGDESLRVHYEDDEIVMGVLDSWSTDFHMGINGWVVGKREPVEELKFIVEG